MRVFYTLIVIFIALDIYGIDSKFRFPELSLPKKVNYERSRKLCIFPFRQTKEDKKLEYLSKGIPSIILNELDNLSYVYDKDVIPETIYHPYGDQKKVDQDFFDVFKKEYTPDEIKRENLELLPEDDPRYIPFKAKILEEEPSILLEQAVEYGKRFDCFYMITGEFHQIGEDFLDINIELTHRKDRSLKRFQTKTSIKRGYQELPETTKRIKIYLFNQEITTVKILSKGTKDVLVFIDEVYQGKTPLTLSDIPVAKHRLKLMKNGYYKTEKIIFPKKNKISTYNFPLTLKEKTANLTVTSKPKGSSVYLGGKLIGKTPIKDAKVYKGLNQIRISQKKYIDYFGDVDLKDGKNPPIHVSLKEGDTKLYYKTRMNVFLDYTYFDFSLYSMYGVIPFYAGFMYNQYKINQIRDSLNAELSLNILSFAQGLSNPTDSFKLQVLYENEKVKRIENKIYRHRRNQQVLQVGGFAMAVCAVTFFWLGYNVETTEVGIHQNQIGHTGLLDTETYVKFNFRF